MSLSWRNRLRILAGPERVAFCRLGRGYGSPVRSSRFEQCAPADPPGDWRGAAAALDEGLRAPDCAGAAATILLSNAFLRYQVVPWMAELGGGAERDAFVRHCFQRVYGDKAGAWEIRASRDAWGAPALASAVDRELVDALAATARRHRVRVASVQPYLMWAFNRWRRAIRTRDFCLVLIENGCACIAVVVAERWHAVRCAPAGGEDPRPALAELVERELRLAALDPGETSIYVRAPASPGGLDLGGDRLRRCVVLGPNGRDRVAAADDGLAAISARV